jgi:hypothetical protein
MTLVALIATACAQASPSRDVSSGGPATASAPASATSSLAAASSAPSALTLADEHDVPAPCISGPATVEATALFWIGCTTGGTATAQIVVYRLPAGPAEVVYQPARPGSGISLLHTTDGWITWAEYTDLREAKDAKLYALQRQGGKPVLLDDATAHQPLAALMDSALDGADAYWTLPLIESGKWHGQLMHKHLPDGPTTVAVQAPLGSVVGWISAFDGSLAYEISSQTETPQTKITVQTRGGTARDLDVGGPASEPALGDGFVAFKAADRYAVGDLAVIRIADGIAMKLGPGEAPMANGRFVTWKSTPPGDGALMLARPLSQCIQRLGDNPESRKSFPSLGATRLAWVFRDPNRSGTDSARVRYAALPDPDAPCPGAR